MILGHYSFETPIDFLENWNHYLVVENPRQLSEYIKEMLDQIEGEEGGFILMEDCVKMDISKVVEVVINPFSTDPNTKKNISSLHDLVNKVAYDDLCYLRTDALMNEIMSYIEDLSSQQHVHSMPMKDLDFKGLLKLIDVRFNIGPETILERICSFIEITQEFSGVKLFVLINLRSFLTDDEIHSFNEFMHYKKLRVLHIENITFDFKENDSVKIIDKDLCEIPVNPCNG